MWNQNEPFGKDSERYMVVIRWQIFAHPIKLLKSRHDSKDRSTMMFAVAAAALFSTGPRYMFLIQMVTLDVLTSHDHACQSV